MSLGGRAVVVTGGASGIGLATVRALSGEGRRVVLADRDAERVEAEAAALRAGGGLVDGAILDVTDEAAVDRLIKGVDADAGLGGLVNSAGVAQFGTVADVSAADWERVVGINLTGTYLTCKAAIPCLERRGGGAIVNLASISGRTKSIHSAPNYVASKAGVIGLTMTLAAQHAATGVRVNCVAPGVIETPMTSVYTDEQRAGIVAAIPMARIGTAAEVAQVIVTLLSDAWSYVTGQTINVNGGQFMQ